MSKYKTLQLLWTAAATVKSWCVFNSKLTEKETDTCQCVWTTRCSHVWLKSLSPSSQSMSSFEMLKIECLHSELAFKHTLNTKTPPAVFTLAYHWVYDEAAANDLHAVHNVADGFTLGHLCSQLTEEQEHRTFNARLTKLNTFKRLLALCKLQYTTIGGISDLIAIKCLKLGNCRALLAWNERQKYKAGQTVNLSHWPYMKNEQFSFVSSILLNTG